MKHAIVWPTDDDAPEFREWLDYQPMESTQARDALWVGAHCWLDQDDSHVWFAHVCDGERWTETMLVHGRPTGEKGNGSGWCATERNPLTVAPSLSCDECGFHAHFLRGSFPPFVRRKVHARG